MKPSISKGKIILVLILLGAALGVYFFIGYVKSHKQEFALGSLASFVQVSKFLPIEPDTKKEIEVIGELVSELTAVNGETHTFLLLLQNNYELRPGGGFLGQYGVLKVKDGKITSFYVEDANLLDQRITDGVTPPWPLKRYMQIKNWKFRDSNFSPDFPENVEKAEYFYRLGNGATNFDGVIAINADVLNHVLAITGPITISGFGTYTSENAAIELEEDVELAYLGDDVPAESKQHRKDVMKRLAAEIVERAMNIQDIKKFADLGLTELRDKNIQLYFHKPELQALIESVHWGGRVAVDWGADKDYLYVVDANMGALKSDYYVRRSLDYVVDFTTETPTATLTYTYDHTATHGDWRTSDYHTYTRVLAPLGSKYIEGSRVKTGGVSSWDDEDWQKTVFSYKVDALIDQTLPTSISYTLPDTITAENYELLIQKQSGIGTIPVTVTVKTPEEEHIQTANLEKDIRFSFQMTEEERSN